MKNSCNKKEEEKNNLQSTLKPWLMKYVRCRCYILAVRSLLDINMFIRYWIEYIVVSFFFSLFGIFFQLLIPWNISYRSINHRISLINDAYVQHFPWQKKQFMFVCVYFSMKIIMTNRRVTFGFGSSMFVEMECYSSFWFLYIFFYVLFYFRMKCGYFSFWNMFIDILRCFRRLLFFTSSNINWLQYLYVCVCVCVQFRTVKLNQPIPRKLIKILRWINECHQPIATICRYQIVKIRRS